jgi:probable rRNA maturation factor
MLNIINNHKEVDKNLLRRAAEEAFLYLGDDFEANLKFMAEDEIKNLNNDYRGQDKPTDVLSFRLEEENGGDIIICPEIAEKEAREWGMTTDSIWQLLLVHGILHLSGFDHEKEQDRAKMEEAEATIMAKLGIILER